MLSITIEKQVLPLRLNTHILLVMVESNPAILKSQIKQVILKIQAILMQLQIVKVFKQLYQKPLLPQPLMLQTGASIKVVSSAIVLPDSTTVLLLSDMNKMNFGLLEIHGEPVGENKVTLILLGEILVVFQKLPLMFLFDFTENIELIINEFYVYN